MQNGDHKDLGRILGNAGWRQGAILKTSLLDEIKDLLPEYVTCAVVISQDCDIVRDQQTEPYIEVVCGSWVPKSQSEFETGRHPRQLSLSCESRDAHLLLDIRKRSLVPKRVFVDSQSQSQTSRYEPDDSLTLSRDSVKLLAAWIADRYTRVAFPDTFNERLSGKTGKTIEALTKKAISQHVTGVYVMMNTENELPETEPYEVLLWFACRQDIYEESGDDLDSVRKFATEFVAALKECPGVVVLEEEDGWEVRGEHHISLADLREFKRFSYDHRSRAKKPGGDLPVT